MNDGAVHLPDQIFHKSRSTQTISTGQLAGGVGNLGIEGVGDALFHLFILYLLIHTCQLGTACGEDFFGGEAGHTAAVEGAGFEEAGVAGDFVLGDGDGGAEGTCPSGLGGAEDGDGGFPEEGGEVHGAAVVAENEAGVGEPVGEFKGGGFSRKIGNGGAEGLSDGLAGGAVVGPAEENGSERVGFLEGANDRGEGGGIPAFGGSVGGAGEDGEVGLDGGVLGFGERGWWGEFRFSGREAEVLEEAKILVGNVDVAVGSGAAGVIFGEEGVTEWSREAGSVGSGESFEGSAHRVWEKGGGGDEPFFDDGVKGKWRGWGGNEFDSWKKDGGQRSKRWGTDDEKWGATIQPALVEVDGGEGEDEVTQPVGQAEEVRIAR